MNINKIIVRSGMLKKIGYEFLWVGSGQALVAIGSLVGIRLLTDVLPVSMYGELSLGMTLTMLISQTVFGPISGAAVRYYSPAKEKDEFFSFIFALRRLITKGTVIVILGMVIIGIVFALSNSFILLPLFTTTVIYALLFGYNAIMDGVQNAARQRSVVAWHQAFSTWGRYLIAFGLIFWIGPSSLVAMIGYVIAILLTLISQIVFFRRTLLPKSNYLISATIAGSYWEAQMYKYAWPFATWGIFTWVQFASDRWVLQFFRGAQDVGLYTVLYQLGYYPITILSTLLSSLLTPIFFQHAGDGSDVSRIANVHSLSLHVAKISLGLTIVFTVVAFIFHNLVFELFTASEYHDVSWLLPGMVLAGGLFSTGQFMAIDIMSKTQTQNLIVPKIVTALIGVILNLYGAIYFGILGIVIGAIIFSAIYLFWILFLMKKSNITYKS